MTQAITRADAEVMALRFLKDQGPHTLPNPIDTEEAMGACLVFLGLEKKGLVQRTNFGGGFVQFALNDAGEKAIPA